MTGLLYLDNYEEALESVEEVRSSLLIALIDRKINKYFASIDGVVKKLEKDKYFLVMRRKSLEQLKEKKFNILEEVKSVNIGNEMGGNYQYRYRYQCGIRMRILPNRPGSPWNWLLVVVVTRLSSKMAIISRILAEISDDGKDYQSESQSESPCSERIYEQ